MYPIPVSKTKIIPPRRRPEILTRKRLLDMLFEALDKKLALVSAPAGYGKTSLLIDLADQSELPCCWLALDEMDRDPQRFAAYFIAALMERFPTFGGQSKNALENMSSFEQDMERLLVTLCNEIIETIREHFIFVLDDFHLLDGVQPIQNFINRFIQLMDENCHLVISSRILTSLNDLPLLVAREQVGGLSFSDLAFQPDELQALLAQNNHLQVSDEQAQRLIEETEGWITGLQFSGADVLKKHTARSLIDEGADLFDYLGQQVLDRQPADLQEVILRTAMFDEFDASLCQSVLAPFHAEPQDWQNWIKLIARNNLFALPVGADGRWLRYHHLFRDFIRARFERERPQEMQPLLFRLEAAYEDMGEWEKAHYICKKINDINLLAEMVERSTEFMFQRAIVTLESWLNELPPSLLRNRPGLLSIRGAILCTKGDVRDGLDLLIQAEQTYRQEKNAYGLNLTLVRRATAYRFLGDYAASLRDVEDVIQSTQSSDDMQGLYAEALRLKGLVLFRLGNARQSIPYLERSLNLYQQNDKSNIPVLLMETGMAYRATGNFSDARNSYEKALHIWRQSGNLLWQASLLNNMGGMYHVQGEYEKAVYAFEEGLLCAQRSRYARLDILISIGLGDLFAELEDFSMAEQNYRYASEAFQGMDDHFLSHSLFFAKINLALLQQDAETARILLDDAAESLENSSSNYEHGYLSLLQGRLFLLEKDSERAVRVFKKAEQCFLEDNRDLETAIARVWHIAASCQAGNPAEAAQGIKSLYGNRSQIPHAVLVAVHQARSWLDALQNNPDIARSIRDLFSQADRLANKIPPTRRQVRRQAHVIQGPTPHLAIQAFGQTVVSLGGRPLAVSDWQTQSVRELFFFFLTISKPMTREQIGEILWPDIYEPAKLKLRFKNEIYRLRKAVGQEVILYKDIYYSFNRKLDYEYDVEAFESHLARAKETENNLEKIGFFQKAVDLVKGPYLNDIYQDWAIHDRERLGQMYLNALAALGNLYQTNAQPEKALEICWRAIAFDPGYEAAYQISMQAYHRLSDKASIRNTYQACAEAMKRQFGLPPSPETEELYRRLSL
ncbi:MAG: tetratricopeptide repeat protein [Anaerolineales bacterium]|nr:tetratricopeptide repeat protein [Anaerolineales bacterium]